MSRILFVDDNPNTLELLSELYNENDNSVFTAESQRDALELVQNNPIDVVFIDLDPECHCYCENVAERIHAKSPRSSIYLMEGFDPFHIATQCSHHYPVLSKSKLIFNQAHLFDN